MDSFITIFDEKSLLLHLQQSDENAFVEIYNHYPKKLFSKTQKLHDLSKVEEQIKTTSLQGSVQIHKKWNCRFGKA
ncbi:MAG: hypothetical protein JWR72_4114 [Flavisolibacter sp.]|jgi:hypothetical protein|nr:hypothetical protein [Flavisolibacter sp.]